MENTNVSFDNQKSKDFYRELCQQVEEYFKTSGKSKQANFSMVVKTLVCLTAWAGSFLMILLGDLPPILTYPLWAFLGFSIALLCVNVGHDAIHGAYSKKKWVNDLLSHTFNLNGASAYMWKRMHNVAHHTYTNIHGLDEDVESVPLLRFSPQTKWMSAHKYQHIYGFLFYGLATISWVFIKDYKKFFENKVGNVSREKHKTREYFYLFFYKLLNYSIFLVLPYFIMEQPWYHILGGYLIMHFVSGYTLAIIFMLAHIVERTHHPRPNEANLINNSWAAHQLYTTADFAGKNPIALFVTGGLNLQVIHHLFPNICSIHYPKLIDIVESTAHKYGLPYKNYPSFVDAFKSHIQFLKIMGKEDIQTWTEAA